MKIDKKKVNYFLFFLLMLSIKPKIVQAQSCCNTSSPSCTNTTFRWEGSVEGAQLPANTSTKTFSVNTADGSIDVTLEIIDPYNRNSDADAHQPGSHPFDPAGGCSSLYNQSVSGCSQEKESADNITGDGSIVDPWDGDCQKSFTQTNGAYGLDYLTLFMYAENSNEEVEYKFTFSKPTTISNFKISDIDAQGYFIGLCPETHIGNSYQDEVRLVAKDFCENNVPLTIQTSSTTSQVIVDNSNQTIKSRFDSTADNDLRPDDLNGEISINSTEPIKSFSIFYSNGPDDAAYEQNNPEIYSWWSDTYGRTNGVSDDQGIRVAGFDMCVYSCACNVAVQTTPDQYYCEFIAGVQSFGATATGGVGPYTYEWNNGLGAGQSKTSGSTSTSTFTVTVTDANGCTATDNITIFIEKPTVQTTSDQYHCEFIAGAQSFGARATGGIGPYTYEWSNGLGVGQSKTSGSASTSTFTVTVTDANGCTATDDITITLGEDIILQSEYKFQEQLEFQDLPSSNEITVCEGSRLELSVGPNSFTEYIWTGPNGFKSRGNANGDILVAQIFESSMKGTYTVTAKDVNDCYATTTITVSSKACSCNLDIIISEKMYQDNNSTNPEQHTFTFKATINGQGTSGWQMYGLENGVPSQLINSGNYGQTITIGPLPVDQNGSLFYLVDAENTRCTQSVSVNMGSCIYLETCTCCKK